MPRCLTLSMVTDRVPIGCNTGLITGFTHMGVNAQGSEAEKLGLCSSGTTGDSPGNSCTELS